MTKNSSSVRLWLFLCCAMIFIMALIGAITRLTESGLSIVEWAPVKGALPPLNSAEWERAFDAYKQTPQYMITNRGMDLEAFKGIFFWEWIHRLWGRLIGFVFLLPYIYFAARRQLDRGLALRLLAIFALGGLQGFIGWFMVQSGLEARTTVSPYRLALHLGFALLLYALILWQALGIGAQRKSKRSCSGWFLLGMIALTICWGAFVAGLRAGGAYNTWPLMDGHMLPPESFTLLPGWLNAFENTALVQFIHRWLAPLTGSLILIWVWRGLTRVGVSVANKKWLVALGAMVFVQIALGILTLLTQVNIVLATLHQAGAITLLTLMLINQFKSEKA